MIEYDYLNALKTFLEEQLLLEPLAEGAIGTIAVGRFQDDPQTAPAVVSLMVGDPQDEAYEDMLFIDKQRGFSETALQGGWIEVGGGRHYWYQFSAYISYYMTLSGDNQDSAHMKNAEVIEWLTRQIQGAQPWVVGYTGDDTTQLIEVSLTGVRRQEGGGPPNSYIWRSRIRWRVLVHKG